MVFFNSQYVQCSVAGCRLPAFISIHFHFFYRCISFHVPYNCNHKWKTWHLNLIINETETEPKPIHCLKKYVNCEVHCIEQQSVIKNQIRAIIQWQLIKLSMKNQHPHSNINTLYSYSLVSRFSAHMNYSRVYEMPWKRNTWIVNIRQINNGIRMMMKRVRSREIKPYTYSFAEKKEEKFVQIKWNSSDSEKGRNDNTWFPAPAQFTQRWNEKRRDETTDERRKKKRKIINKQMN